MTIAVIVACIIVLVVVLATSLFAQRCALVAGCCALVAGCCALVAGRVLAGRPKMHEAIYGGRGHAPRRAKSAPRRAKSAPRPAKSLFAQLREPSRLKVANRLEKLFQTCNFTKGFDIAMNGPASDEATMSAIFEAWCVHFGGADSPWEQSRLARLSDHLPTRHSFEDSLMRYLDIGDGSAAATIARLLGLPPARVVAADFCIPPALNPAVEHIRIDGQKLPFEAGTFGLITMFMAAHRFADAPQIFAEAYRISQPGARLILCEYSGTGADAILYYSLVQGIGNAMGGKKTPRGEAKGAHYRSPDEWERLATEAGFVLDFRGTLLADDFDSALLTFSRK